MKFSWRRVSSLYCLPFCYQGITEILVAAKYDTMVLYVGISTKVLRSPLLLLCSIRADTSYYSIVDALFFCIPNTISPLEKINIHLEDEVDSKRVRVNEVLRW